MKNLLYTILGFIILTVSHPVKSSHDYTPIIADPLTEEWRYSFYPEFDQLSIQCIASNTDINEYWFGLDSGIARYNGYDWTFFNESSGLKGNVVQEILAHDNGIIVAGTSNGVFKLENGSWHPLLSIKGSSNLLIKKIRLLKDGTISIASSWGVFLLKDNNKTLLSSNAKWKEIKSKLDDTNFTPIPQELLSFGEFDNFSDIYEVSPGQLWLAVTNHLQDEKGEILIVDQNEIVNSSIQNFKLFSKFYGINLGYEQNILETSKGDIWIVNKSNKIPAIRYSKGKWEEIYYADRFGDDEYSESIIETKNGTIWLSGIGNIYSLSPEGKWSKYNSENFNIPHGHTKLHSNSEGKLWIFSPKSAVVSVDLSLENWLTYKGINYHCSQSKGENWFLDFEGNSLKEINGNWEKSGIEDGLMNQPVSLYCDNNDVIWAVGSQDNVAALSMYNNNHWETFTFESVSWGIDYRAIMQSQDGSLWIGGSTDILIEKGQTGGVIQILYPYSSNRKLIVHKSMINGLNQQNAYGIAQSKNGDIWIGGTGLCRYNSNTWNYLSNPDLNNYVNNVHSDQEGVLYVGSRIHGLYVYKNDTWTIHSVDNGLLSNNIISIASDPRNGSIWLATDKDISFFNGRVWANSVLPDQIKLSYEGGSIFTSKNERQIWVSRCLREWKRRAYTGKIPDKNVRNKFNTYKYIKDTIPPNSKIEVYSKEVDQSGNTSIFWSGKDYFNKTKADMLVYSYQLDESEWSPFSKNQNHTFTNLTNGNHRFSVKAMDTEGNIQHKATMINFDVLPPVWKQAWFIILIGSMMSITLYFIILTIKKQAALEKLNSSLQSANLELADKNDEVGKQRDSLKDAVNKIDELSKAKVKFFTNITHEFRTPLSLILGPIEKLSRDTPPNKKEHSFYELIKKNGIRLQKLINQLLEIRMIETSTLDLSLTKSDIVSFVHETSDLFNNQAKERSISFDFESDFKQFQIYFDNDKIEKILFNLLSNAFKHTSENGTITVSLKQSEKYLMKDNSLDFIRLIVEDNGTGLDESIIDNLFERFTVGNNEIEEYKSDNSGIGLSYIKDLIESHQGNIKVESSPGKGTRFTVFIPENLDDSSSNQNMEENGSPLHKFSLDDINLEADSITEYEKLNQFQKSEFKTILIAEDNQDMRFFLSSILSEDYNLLLAANGEEGLQLLGKEYVDLIISDIMMPIMDGISFCDKIKSDPSTSHLPVILLTALAIDNKKIEGYTSGADSYIIKPFDPALIQARVKNLLESRDILKSKYADDLRFKPKDIKVTGADDDFLENLSGLLENHVSDSQFDIAKMCEMLSMSHMHFIRKVKQLTGKKPIELLKTYRLGRAKQLLSQDKINVAEVGYMVGYDLPNSFTRAFKNEFGMSPTKYVSDVQSSDGNHL